MISEGYQSERTLKRRIEKMESFLADKPALLKADPNAKYHTVLDIDMSSIKEPILCCPNDPDDAKLLSDVAGRKIDEVFIGSCMTNIGHFRAAAEVLKTMPAGQAVPTRLWIAPPTKMDEAQLIQEGHYSTYGTAGARLEMPGCSLCMGNQARIAEKSTALQELVWKCQGAPCAWATRPASLKNLRHCRSSFGNARVLPVHGQPGP